MIQSDGWYWEERAEAVVGEAWFGRANFFDASFRFRLVLWAGAPLLARASNGDEQVTWLICGSVAVGEMWMTKSFQDLFPDHTCQVPDRCVPYGTALKYCEACRYHSHLHNAFALNGNATDNFQCSICDEFQCNSPR